MQSKIDKLANTLADYNNHAEENGYYVNVSNNNVVYVSSGKAVHVCGIGDIQSVIIQFNGNELIIITEKESIILTKEGPKS